MANSKELQGTPTSAFKLEYLWTHYQPLRGLYLTAITISVLARVPFWFLRYLLPSSRPRPSWTLSRSLLIAVFKNLIPVAEGSGLFSKFPIPPADADEKELSKTWDLARTNEEFVWVDAVDKELLKEEIAEYALKQGVEPIRVWGYWLYKDQETRLQFAEDKFARKEEKVIYHLHGGGFYTSSAHNEMSLSITSGILQQKPEGHLMRSFAVEYRLTSSSPNPSTNPFPAALLDCLAGYIYLVRKLNFTPENIILSGDSAGGNLALALVRYLRFLASDNSGINSNSLGMPGGLVPMSPWTDISMSRIDPSSSAILNNHSDLFPAINPHNTLFMSYSVRSYLGKLTFEDARTNIWISPCSLHGIREGAFKGFPPTYIIVGGAERLYDDSVALHSQMEADGVNVQLFAAPDAVHDFLGFLWWKETRAETFQRLVDWIESL